MTYRLDPAATRRVGRHLVADAGDLAAAAGQVVLPDTGYRDHQVADVIQRLSEAAVALAGRTQTNGRALYGVTEQMLAVDEWIGLGLRWE